MHKFDPHYPDSQLPIFSQGTRAMSSSCSSQRFNVRIDDVLDHHSIQQRLQCICDNQDEISYMMAQVEQVSPYRMTTVCFIIFRQPVVAQYVRNVFRTFGRVNLRLTRRTNEEAIAYHSKVWNRIAGPWTWGETP